MTPEHALDEIEEEFARAKAKFPGAFVNFHEAYAVLLEEVDEMWDDIKADRKEDAVREAMQVAAMALRIMVELG